MRYRALRSRGAVNASTFFAGIIAAVSLGTVGSAQATTIDLELGAVPNITSKVTNSLSVLNGIALQGQTLSLDFTFSHGKFVRLFTITSSPFVALLKLKTNGSGMVDFLDGTGFLVDQQGNPLQQPLQLGSSSTNHALAAALFPLLPGGLPRPLNFFGIHFDLTLPVDPSISITGEKFLLMSDSNGPFGVGPGVVADIVPDQGSTLLFLGLALLGPILARSRFTRIG
jgi:hypothetical protein